MYAVEIEKDVTDRFIEIPEYEKFKSKHIKVIFMTDLIQPESKDKSVDFSKYQVNCFKDVDPVDFQRKMRDEW